MLCHANVSNSGRTGREREERKGESVWLEAKYRSEVRQLVLFCHNLYVENEQVR